LNYELRITNLGIGWEMFCAGGCKCWSVPLSTVQVSTSTVLNGTL